MKTIELNAKHILGITDLHFGVRASSEEWQENISSFFFEWFIPYLKKLKETYKDDLVIFVLGDVFDDRKHIDVAVNDICIEIFTQIAKIFKVIIINGNHDLYRKTTASGITSLRSLSNIKNVTVLKEPAMIDIHCSESLSRKVAMIPFLGDISLENDAIAEAQKAGCDAAFMHTDISNMKYDNGMTITKGVDNEKFAGTIFSGHIHKRQESKKVVYLGSPYQMSRGDIGNNKGFYIIDASDFSYKFINNDFSPRFQKIDYKDFCKFDDMQQRKFLSNSYTDIVITDPKDVKNVNEIYALSNIAKAKRVQIAFNLPKEEIEISDEDIRDISIEEMVISVIDNLTETSIEEKEALKKQASNYLRTAEA